MTIKEIKKVKQELESLKKVGDGEQAQEKEQEEEEEEPTVWRAQEQVQEEKGVQVQEEKGVQAQEEKEGVQEEKKASRKPPGMTNKESKVASNRPIWGTAPPKPDGMSNRASKHARHGEHSRGK